MVKLGKIEVNVPDCPTYVPNVAGIPSWVVGWSLGVGTVLLLALIIGIALVRLNAHDNRTERYNKYLDAQTKIAGQRKTCPFCQGDYNPKLPEDDPDAKGEVQAWR